MIAMLASGFSVLALALAAVGLYGILSYAVTRRTPEIGVRMALGARRGDVLRMIFGEVLRLVAIGVAIAIPVAFLGGKLVNGMLFGVSVTDPAAMLITAGFSWPWQPSPFFCRHAGRRAWIRWPPFEAIDAFANPLVRGLLRGAGVESASSGC